MRIVADVRALIGVDPVVRVGAAWAFVAGGGILGLAGALTESPQMGGLGALVWSTGVVLQIAVGGRRLLRAMRSKPAEVATRREEPTDEVGRMLERRASEGIEHEVAGSLRQAAEHLRAELAAVRAEVSASARDLNEGSRALLDALARDIADLGQTTQSALLEQMSALRDATRSQAERWDRGLAELARQTSVLHELTRGEATGHEEGLAALAREMSELRRVTERSAARIAEAVATERAAVLGPEAGDRPGPDPATLEATAILAEFNAMRDEIRQLQDHSAASIRIMVIVTAGAVPVVPALIQQVGTPSSAVVLVVLHLAALFLAFAAFTVHYYGISVVRQGEYIGHRLHRRYIGLVEASGGTPDARATLGWERYRAGLFQTAGGRLWTLISVLANVVVVAPAAFAIGLAWYVRSGVTLDEGLSIVLWIMWALAALLMIALVLVGSVQAMMVGRSASRTGEGSLDRGTVRRSGG